MFLNNEPTDKELLELMSRDNKVAFNTLYNRYWNRMLSLAFRKTDDFMEAENIVQDVFFSLWKRRHDLQLSGEFENYLVVSIKYRVIKMLNKQKSKREHEGSVAASIDLLDDSTQEYLAFDELYARLEKAINELPEKSQLIYRMSKEQGLSYRAIADELNISEKAVNSHLVRIKRNIRSKLNSFIAVVLL